MSVEATCNICHCTFSKTKSLYRHQRVAHGMEVKTTKSHLIKAQNNKKQLDLAEKAIALGLEDDTSVYSDIENQVFKQYEMEEGTIWDNILKPLVDEKNEYKEKYDIEAKSYKYLSDEYEVQKGHIEELREEKEGFIETIDYLKSALSSAKETMDTQTKIITMLEEKLKALKNKEEDKEIDILPAPEVKKVEVKKPIKVTLKK